MDASIFGLEFFAGIARSKRLFFFGSSWNKVASHLDDRPEGSALSQPKASAGGAANKRRLG